MTVIVKMTPTENKAKSLVELKEILQRQEKLLANKKFIDKLPDKGEKIRKCRDSLLKEIAEKDQVEQSCRLLSALSIQPTKVQIQDIEWSKNDDKGNECLDSDDDSEPDDPIAIIASSTDVSKKIIHLKPEKKLITDDDIKEIENNSDDADKLEINKHTKYVCEMAEKSNLGTKESFKPYKSSISNVHDPSKEKCRKKHKNWEVTAATPPPIINGPVKEISIQESLELQSFQSRQLKEMQIKQASEKLALQLGSKVDEELLKSFAQESYREITEIECNSDAEEEYQEVHDEEPRDGGVVFTITD